METFALLQVAVDYEESKVATLQPPQDWLYPSVGTVAIGVAMLHLPAQALMRYGDVGRGVVALQEQLTLPADGIYGTQTYQQVRSFQTQRGLQVDGIAGPATLTALGLDPNLNPHNGTGGLPSNSAVVTARIGLIVRDRPNGTQIGGLDRGERVTLTDDRQSAGGRFWVQLTRGGWIAEDYLRYGNEVPASSGVYVSAQSGLLVRDRPNGYEIGGLANGQRVALTGSRELAGGRSWVQLQRGGWVAEDYLVYQ